MQTKESIKAILKNYQTLEMKRRLYTSTGKNSPEIEEFTLVLQCISVLKDDVKDIIEQVFERGMSAREYAKRHYMSRTTVQRKIDTALQLIAESFV